MRRNVLVVGGGGREDALVWKLSQSPSVGRIYAAPGNGGTQSRGRAFAVPISPMNFEELARFAKEKDVYLTIVGPEDPICSGTGDRFRAEGLRIFCPSRRAARVESSKAYAKRFMAEENIPTAEFRVFRNYERALAFVRKSVAPVVIKANGLTAGKGVFPCKTIQEAEDALKMLMVDRVFGHSADEIVIEEFLVGQEVSVHIFCGGKTWEVMPLSQDHKLFGGRNTGGMGVVSPLPWADSALMKDICRKIVVPTMRGLAKRGLSFTGCLYPGLIITADGPKVLEYNARFGDPETQVYMRMLQSDLFEVTLACAEERLDDMPIAWNPLHTACVALVSSGYPTSYRTGFPICGLSEAEYHLPAVASAKEGVPSVVVFHGATKYGGQGLCTAGGRVLHVTATSESCLRDAVELAYKAAGFIHFEGKDFEKHIGIRSLRV